jgi:hypothetical protein
MPLKSISSVPRRNLKKSSANALKPMATRSLLNILRPHERNGLQILDKGCDYHFVSDMDIPEEKWELVAEARNAVDKYQKAFRRGLSLTKSVMRKLLRPGRRPLRTLQKPDEQPFRSEQR